MLGSSLVCPEKWFWDEKRAGVGEMGWIQSSVSPLFAHFYPLDHKTLSELTIVDPAEGLQVILSFKLLNHLKVKKDYDHHF